MILKLQYILELYLETFLDIVIHHSHVIESRRTTSREMSCSEMLESERINEIKMEWVPHYSYEQ
jgi:hypothetical protein